MDLVAFRTTGNSLVLPHRYAATHFKDGNSPRLTLTSRRQRAQPMTPDNGRLACQYTKIQRPAANPRFLRLWKIVLDFAHDDFSIRATVHSGSPFLGQRPTPWQLLLLGPMRLMCTILRRYGYVGFQDRKALPGAEGPAGVTLRYAGYPYGVGTRAGAPRPPALWREAACACRLDCKW
jgi:hypothetical protein